MLVTLEKKKQETFFKKTKSLMEMEKGEIWGRKREKKKSIF